VTTADLVVLSLLLERPMHGYDLLDEYRRQER
jgi:DNA-binding PadR family transcriptional regulator